MFGSFLGNLGGNIGSAFGGGVFSSIGRYAGRLLGDYFDSDSNDGKTVERSRLHGRILNNLYIQSSTYGKNIALVYGKAKIAGNIIWALPIEKQLINNPEERYVQDTPVIINNYKFIYFASLAIGICEGEIQSIEQIWANGVLFDDKIYNYRLYYGSQSQLPDPLIMQNLGSKSTPAFRGLCYIVFERLPIADFNNVIPEFTFEVIKKPNLPQSANNQEKMVEDMITSMVMIPGSGEYVYDTIVQYKSSFFGDVMVSQEAINCHNNKQQADALYSLDMLQQTCKNLQWISPVVCWFGNSLNIADCSIYPAVEYRSNGIRLSAEWQVANFDRAQANLISRDALGQPNYGGTVNDASLLRYLDKLRSENLKILLNPMIFMDVAGKPWRGHISGEVAEVNNFFNKAMGYNNFILHYANLVKGKVDGFIIGSELKNITKISGAVGIYPAVYELIKLAERVRLILGPEVKITYAADWSEYHHTTGGWYHLDLLWSSPAIDFIGIDAYFPVTNSSSSLITIEDIQNGWTAGEGYSYYHDDNGNQVPLRPEYAWKNLEFWWNNPHYNPDGQMTEWQPKSKKIWFTEYGFPSVDKASNQPNVFYDPKSIDGGLPNFSNGDIDFALQKKAIKATSMALEKMPFIEHKFLWCWDARPYPAWPHGQIWSDGYLWERGHWVNGKFGMGSLAAIVYDLCLRSGMAEENIDVSQLNSEITGLVLSDQLSINETIHMLRSIYMFDFNLQQNFIRFIKRGVNHATIAIDYSDLLSQGKNSYVSIKIADNKLPAKVRISYIDSSINYALNFHTSVYDFTHSKLIYDVRVPLILNNSEAEDITLNILRNARSENFVINFYLPYKYIFLSPSNLLYLNFLDQKYLLRVNSIDIQEFIIKIQAVVEDLSVYSDIRAAPILPVQNLAITTYFKMIIVPTYRIANQSENDRHILNCLLILRAATEEKLYISHNNRDFTKYAEIINNAIIVKLVGYKNHYKYNYLLDNKTKIQIYTTCNILEFVAGIGERAKLLQMGDELISFNKIEQFDNYIYEISGLVRQCFGTVFCEQTILGEDIAICTIMTQQVNFQNEDVWFKSSNSSASIKLNTNTINIQQTQLATPLITVNTMSEHILYIEWQAQNNYRDNWQAAYIAQAKQYRISLSINTEIIFFTITTQNKLSVDLRTLSIESNVSGTLKVNIIAESAELTASQPAHSIINLI